MYVMTCLGMCVPAKFDVLRAFDSRMCEFPAGERKASPSRTGKISNHCFGTRTGSENILKFIAIC